MLAIDFPERNKVFTKPAGQTDEQCSDLCVWVGPVTIDEAGTQVPAIISKWQFSKEDLEEIARTGHIWLSITGTGMPPVSIFTECPFLNKPEPESEPTRFNYGTDHAIGRFLDITDRRFAGTKDDQQGEGYLLEWSDLFGISTNLIGATVEDLKDQTKLIQLVESFLISKNIPL